MASVSGDTPTVAIGSLGGTIAMTQDTNHAALMPSIGVDELIASVADIQLDARIVGKSLVNKSSPSLSVSDVFLALDFASEAVDQGATGVVITQGTDTLEETAYLLDLLWTRKEPLVITGAMRSPSQSGSDGPGNLRAAILVASSARVRDLGVLVVMADELHAARFVSKSHSTSLSAFSSPNAGPLGIVSEGKLLLHTVPAERFAPFSRPTSTEVNIPIIEVALGDEGHALRALMQTKPNAVVLSALGAGHVPEALLPACDEVIASGCPLIFATRTGAGSTLTRTYGYPGSEEDLIRRGAIPAGRLFPQQARLLAFLLTTSGADFAAIRSEFSVRQG